jgi:hypothetical protein
MTTPAKYLEHLQREARKAGGIPAKTLARVEQEGRDIGFERSVLESLGIKDEKRLGEARKEFRRELREARKTIPTPLEDFHAHSLMKHLAGQLKKAAKQQNLNVPRLPVYGSLPVGQLNAMAIRVPESGEHLIAFQDGVFSFANMLTKAVASSFPFKGESADGEWQKFSGRLWGFQWGWFRNDEPLRRLGEFLHMYLVFGDARQAEQYLVRDPFHLPAFILREGFELFIFGHELGHVIAGHLGSAPEEPHKLGAGELVEASTWDWDMELEADAVGMRLALQAMLNNGCDITLSYCGIDMAFSAMEILDLANSTLLHGKAIPAPSSETHPRPAVRRAFLRDLLRQQIGEKDAKQPIKRAEILEEVLHQMWWRIYRRFKALHAAGERPLSAWSP